MKFNFPPTIFVKRNSIFEQRLHVLSEADELRRELEKSPIDGNLADMEAMDLWHSLETYFQIRIDQVGEVYVESLRRRVIEKNRERGYYGD